MWRHWSKEFRQGFKKTFCSDKQNLLSKDGGTNRNLCCITKLLPKSFQHLDPCRPTEKLAEEDKKGRRNEENSTRNVSNHTFLEAFGWSGALVFGWVISKQWWLKQTWSQDRESLNKHKCKVSYHQSLINLIANTHVKTQPPVNYVLPHQSIPSEKDITDEFEAAAKELQDIHEKALGKSLNRRGIAYLSKSAGTEAIKYFKRASELKYPPASFNLGQCCELGIGMKQDFKQAAEWYKIASEQGHPTAMYNLGVFYAHGWGGLQSDIAIAKQLFVKAAELGQPDAKVALDKESKSSPKLIYTVKGSQIPNGNVKINPVKVQSSELDLFVNKITQELADSVLKREYRADSGWDVPIKSSVAF